MEAAHKLLGRRQAAARIGIPGKTLGLLARTGRIPAVRIGRVFRFNPIHLDEWLRRQSQRASQPEPPSLPIGSPDLADLVGGSLEVRMLGAVLAELREVRRTLVRVENRTGGGA